MDYNRKLEKLIKAAGIKRKAQGFFKTGRMIEKALQDLFEFCQRSGIQIKAVVGMREATKMFYEWVPSFPVSLTPYEQETAVNWSSLTEREAVLVVGSFLSSREVERRFWNKNLKCMILNLYDYFYLRGCECNADFWRYRADKRTPWKELMQKRTVYLKHCYFHYGVFYKVLNHFSISDVLAQNGIWGRTHCLRKGYEFQQDETIWKEMYLQRFIYECVKGRDYLTSEKYITEYVRRGYSNADKYKVLLTGWKAILEDMKKKIGEREQEDLVINWVDAMSRDRMADTPYLQKVAAENVELKNAYTAMPWTTWSMKSIFMEIKPIEGKLFRYKKITLKNSSLLRRMKEKKYDFRYIGPSILQRKLFPDRYSGCREMRESQISSTYYYWKMLCLLAGEKKNLFLMVHELYATHAPFFSPDLEYLELGNGADAGVEQKKRACQYIDRQLEWFDSHLGKKVCRIYMGDHGDRDQIPGYLYLKKETNIMFLIKNSRKKISQTTELFSLERVGKLIEYIMGGAVTSEEEIFSKCIIVENFDWYEKTRIDNLLKEQGDKYTDYRNWMQFRAVRTEKDMLVRYANGEEWYFLLPDEENNYIMDSGFQGRIGELRLILGNELIDVYKEDFFMQSRRLYVERR